MPDPSLEIVHLDPAQIDEAAALLTRAFFDYPAWAWLAPDEGHRREIMPWFMGMSLRYGVLAGETYTTAGAMRGVAIWEPPGRLDADLDGDLAPDGTKTGYDELPQRIGAQATARFEAMIAEQRPVREHVSGGKPVWYLPWLGVDPSLQRSGVGRALLDHVFARADTGGIPCLLETEQLANVPYYERHGFRVVASGTLPLDGPGYWTMLKDPSGV